MELLIVISAFIAGSAVGLLVPHRVLDASFKWAAWILAGAIAIAVLDIVVDLVSQGADSFLLDAEACRVDAEGNLVDVEACTEGHNVGPELYGLTVVGALVALAAGILAGMRLAAARARRRGSRGSGRSA